MSNTKLHFFGFNLVHVAYQQSENEILVKNPWPILNLAWLSSLEGSGPIVSEKLSQTYRQTESYG